MRCPFLDERVGGMMKTVFKTLLTFGFSHSVNLSGIVDFADRSDL